MVVLLEARNHCFCRQQPVYKYIAKEEKRLKDQSGLTNPNQNKKHVNYQLKVTKDDHLRNFKTF